jgi:hypothetical protein
VSTTHTSDTCTQHGLVLCCVVLRRERPDALALHPTSSVHRVMCVNDCPNYAYAPHKKRCRPLRSKGQACAEVELLSPHECMLLLWWCSNMMRADRNMGRYGNKEWIGWIDEPQRKRIHVWFGYNTETRPSPFLFVARCTTCVWPCLRMHACGCVCVCVHYMQLFPLLMCCYLQRFQSLAD